MPHNITTRILSGWIPTVKGASRRRTESAVKALPRAEAENIPGSVISLFFFLLLTSLLLLYATLEVRRQYVALHTFLPIQAVVMKSEVMTVAEKSLDGWTDYSYQPMITYGYVGHDDKEYIARAIYPGGIQPSYRGDYDRAKRFTGNFVEGELVTAYYNPENPNEAFLLREVQKMPLIVLFAFIAALMAGLFIIYRREAVALPAPARSRKRKA